MGFDSALKLNNLALYSKTTKAPLHGALVQSSSRQCRAYRKGADPPCGQSERGEHSPEYDAEGREFSTKGLSNLSKIPPDSSILRNVNAIWGFKHHGMVFLSILLDKSTAYVKYDLLLHHYNLLCSIKINLMSSASFFLLFFFPSP